MSVNCRGRRLPGPPASSLRSSAVPPEGGAQLLSAFRFPPSATEIGRETITTPLGENDCYRHDVTREGLRSTFWFAVNRPGLPVKFMTVANGTPVVTAELVKDERVGE